MAKRKKKDVAHAVAMLKSPCTLQQLFDFMDQSAKSVQEKEKTPGKERPPEFQHELEETVKHFREDGGSEKVTGTHFWILSALCTKVEEDHGINGDQLYSTLCMVLVLDPEAWPFIDVDLEKGRFRARPEGQPVLDKLLAKMK